MEIGFCGWNCSGCGNYKKNMNCQGCHVDQEMISDCPTRDCAKQKGCQYCSECDEFPCAELDAFYHEREKNMLAYECLCQMRKKKS